MAVTDLHTALVMLKGALPSLETLADADAHRQDLLARSGALAGEIAALESQRDAVARRVAEETNTAETAWQQRAKGYDAQIGVAEARIEDLQRSQQTAEQNLAATRVTLERLRAEHETQLAQDESAHRTRLAGVLQQEQEATARLAGIQARIQAIHGDLAGMTASQA